MKIVYLHPPNFSGGLLHLTKTYCKRGGLNPLNIHFTCLTARCLYKRTKTKFDARPERKEIFLKNLEDLNPDFVVINDRAALKYITNKYLSLALTRGGIYYWQNAKGISIPCLVVDEIRKTKSTNSGSWIHLQDMKKLYRWTNNKQRDNPKFNYQVCRTVDDVNKFTTLAEDAFAIAIDIETTGSTIACIGYTCWMKNNKLITYVIPFYNPSKPNGCHWDTEEDEVRVWQYVKQIHANNAYKGMQNGQYDTAYFISYRIPVKNYIVDSLHLFHSIWREAPKRLDFISSISLDYYHYWKDEGKEDASEDKKGYTVPRNAAALENYWLYNALDCYNTMLSISYLLPLVLNPKLVWAKTNYLNEFESQFGFCQAVAMRGVKVNSKLQLQMGLKLAEKAQQAEEDLKIMVDDPEFNPNSPKQTQELIYDILQAIPMPRKGKTTNEIILKFIKQQSYLLDIIIEKIWEKKKNQNNATKYGMMPLLNNRFMYGLSAAGTYPGRFASKSHHFWIGQNIQNMPKSMRYIIEPDEGYFLFDIDYSQSDAYFTAFESEDKKYMNTMLDDRDTHCVHAEHFFKRDYNELLQGHANHEDWVDHPLTGIRQNTKRITYGANYLMTAYTLFITMGRDAAIGAAKSLGYDDAASWDVKQFTYLCQKFLDAYFQFYPGILDWLFGEHDTDGNQITESEIDRTIARGNLATAAFGNTMLFFGDLRNDKKRQRDFAAFWGQGGTAGNINRALRRIYKEERKSSYFMSLFQVHDSFIGQIKQSCIHQLPDLMRLMENRICIKGRNFTVPTEASIGLGWGGRQINWHEGLTKENIIDYDRKWLVKNEHV